jgi:hypothetical protein
MVSGVPGFGLFWQLKSFLKDKKDKQTKTLPEKRKPETGRKLSENGGFRQIPPEKPEKPNISFPPNPLVSFQTDSARPMSAQRYVTLEKLSSELKWKRYLQSEHDSCHDLPQSPPLSKSVLANRRLIRLYRRLDGFRFG